MLTYAQCSLYTQSENTNNHFEIKQSDIALQKACDIMLIHPDNDAYVKPIFHQDNYIILMDWEDYVSPEGDDIVYSLEIWNKMEPSNIYYYQLSESYKYLIVDHLQIYDTFIWQVKAMDHYGVACQSQTSSFIKTDPSMGDAGISYILIEDAKCQYSLANASIQLVDSSYKIQIFHPDKRFFHIEGPFGTYELNVIAPNYQSKQKNIHHTNSNINYLFLNRMIYLKNLIYVLKLLSGFEQNYDCPGKIDWCMNQAVDLDDAIYMMNILSEK
jgi:hypothetical protein